MPDGMDKYEKIKVLGQGSYGKVYMMKHKQQKKLFCLKNISLRALSAKEKDFCKQEVGHPARPLSPISTHSQLPIVRRPPKISVQWLNTQ